VTDSKFHDAVLAMIAGLGTDEIENLKALGTESATFARLAQRADPFWPKAMAAELQR